MADAARILYGADTAEGGTWSNACLEEQFDSAFALMNMFPSARGETGFSERPGSLLLGCSR